MGKHLFRATALVGLLAAAISPASAVFHLMIIDEVYVGHPGMPDAQYVVLRMWSRGETLVGGHSILTFSADGTPGPVFGTFANNVAIGLVNSRILMATQAAKDMFGIQPDHITVGRLPFPSGRICFDSETIDCVAYGAFTGNNGTYGQPAVALTQENRMALFRVFFSSTAPRNNASDFALRAPAPRNNAGALAGTDFDADLVPDFSDCAPSDPALWFAPNEVGGVRAALDAQGSARLSWNSQALAAGAGTLYDLALGSAADARRSGALAGTMACGAKELLEPSFADPQPVPAGDGRLYLVRGRNGCGVGSYGDGSPPPGLPDPRDPLDDPLTDPCR